LRIQLFVHAGKHDLRRFREDGGAFLILFHRSLGFPLKRRYRFPLLRNMGELMREQPPPFLRIWRETPQVEGNITSDRISVRIHVPRRLRG
jgi:hypothetical protein